MAFRLIENIRTVLEKDPAAKHWLEVLLCYPSIHVQLFHWVAHPLYRAGVPILPRWIMQIARFFTGIEIHPGARLGRRLFIDHGMGVVIGETAIVGDDCVIFHQVTLGGTGKDTGKRHPTLGNDVIVGAGAAVLGNIRVGDHSRVGANSVVLRDVPEHATVVGIPGRVVVVKGQPIEQPTSTTPQEIDDFIHGAGI
ncbi:serine O-acetyltransferase [bacterium]|nr:serine O-acetyltransferase [bacterium]